MAQKIVIKTGIKPVTQQTDTIEYQWHWHRISVALAVLLTLIVITIWGLMSNVVANEPVEEVSPLVTVKNMQPEVPVALSAAKVEPAVATPLADVLPLHEANTPNAEPKDTAQVLASEQVITQPLAQQEQVNTDIAQSSQMQANSTIETEFVTRALLTSAIAQREPVDVLNEQVLLSQFSEKLFFFTELKNFKGKKVQHLWYFKQQLMAKVEFEITSERYRTYSSKNIMNNQTGEWRLELVDEQQQVLASKLFHIAAQ